RDGRSLPGPTRAVGVWAPNPGGLPRPLGPADRGARLLGGIRAVLPRRGASRAGSGWTTPPRRVRMVLHGALAVAACLVVAVLLWNRAEKQRPVRGGKGDRGPEREPKRSE